MKKYNVLLLCIVFLMVISSIVVMNVINNHSVVLGENELGKVSLEGPYGNPNSENKIAIIVGVHPLEFKSHNSVLKYLKEYSSSLNNSYYVYVIEVTKDKDDFDKGRINGQILARDYVVPDIISKNYSLAIDFHAHRGVYAENNFIIAPLNDEISKMIGMEIIKNISGMKILNFVAADDDHPTSPDYISIPILKNGTPSLIYETYINESENVTDRFVLEFLINLDNTAF
ncbi:MAG: hypothetical protein FWH29_02450 [Methanobrevibacter sp.]|nr:hypothetical protein [Methanobrevibacter sp.]